MILNKQRCLLRGYRFPSNKEVMEKLGVTDFFLWKILGSHREINKKLLQYLTEFVFNDNSMQIINATLNGGCIIGLW